jgi:EmrB/QacA subfamily drug resistance transporter
VNRFLVTVALMLALFLAAVDGTIVGTAMPTIVGALGGLALFSWVFSAYLLTSSVTVPVYGRLADLYGRRRVLLVGTFVFLAGSALCGFARTIVQLIVFRGLQGLGAGAVLPVTQTVIGDIFPLQQRARVQGYFSAVWGVSAVLGPAVGALLVQTVGWRWIFFINLPFGLLAAALLAAFLREEVRPRRHDLDVIGFTSLTAGLTALLLALLQGGQALPWTSPAILGLLAAGASLLAGFLWHERRAAEAVLPLDLFRDRVIAVATAASFLAGLVMMGLSAYLPLYVQGVQGGSAADAGAVVAPLSIGWPVGSVVGGRALLRWGYRPVAVAGGGFLALACGLLLALGRATPRAGPVAIMVVAGFGLGLSTIAFIISVQNGVEWARRGIATAAVQFLRNLGQAVGAAALGAGFNAAMVRGLSGRVDAPLQAANALLDPATRSHMPAAERTLLAAAMMGALRHVFEAVLGASLVAVAVILLFPAGAAHLRGVRDQAAR